MTGHSEKKLSNVKIGWNGKPDYPEFCNAFLESATEDGRELTAEECEKWEENNPELFYELVYESFLL